MQAFDPKSIAGTTRGAIDDVDYIDGFPGLVWHPMPTILPHGAPLLISGWTIDPANGGAPQAVCLLLDRIRPYPAQCGLSRMEIMEREGTPERVGFHCCIPTGDLAVGGHQVQAFALAGDGRWYESATMGFRLYNMARKAEGRTSRPIQVEITGIYDASAGRAPLQDGAAMHGDRWLLVEGWTYDPTAAGSAFSVAAVDADGRFWSGPADIELPERATAIGAKTSRIGFEIAVPCNVFARGRHTLAVQAYDESAREFRGGASFSFDVIAPQRPFPLAARATAEEPTFAAQIRMLAPTGSVEAVDEARGELHPLPAPFSLTPPARIALEGWALDERGNAADDVFIELKPIGFDVPPQRLVTRQTPSAPIRGLPLAPVNGGTFEWTLEAKVLRPGSYDLGLAIVQAGRRTFSRASLGTMRID